MGNPITDALDQLVDVLQAVTGGVMVSRDPAAIIPQVAHADVAVLVGPATADERSSFAGWFLTVPAHVVFARPADPRTLDTAYTVAYELMTCESVEAVSMEANAVQLDASTTLPAVTVTFRSTTAC